MTDKSKEYEDVARAVLRDCREELCLRDVTGPVTKKGTRSGTEWKLEATAVTKTGFYIVECRRHTKDKIKQESVGGVVYRAMDIQAEGVILVSPLGLQRGAKLVAAAESVHEIKLGPDSTAHEYVVSFHAGKGIRASDVMPPMQDQLMTATLKHPDGTVEELYSRAEDED